MNYIQYIAGFLLKLKLSEQILGSLSHSCKFILMASSGLLLPVSTNQCTVFIFFNLLCKDQSLPCKGEHFKKIALILSYSCHIFCEKAESLHFIQILIVISMQSDNRCSDHPGFCRV